MRNREQLDTGRIELAAIAPTPPHIAIPGGSEVRTPRDPSGLDDLDPRLFDLFDGFLGRVEAGEPPDVARFADEYPEFAAEIRELLPAMLGMAELGVTLGERDQSARPEPDHPDGGAVFGDFRIAREIGRGGMGIVYEAEQATLGRRVALKILPLGAAIDPRALQRFQLEARVAGWLEHPRIVPVHDVGMVGQVPYYAMQLIDGDSLANLIGELRGLVGGTDGPQAPSGDENLSSLASGLLSGRFDPRRPADPSNAPPARLLPRLSTSIGGQAYLRTVARLGIQAAEALGYAHDQGIIHRDVKPANLLLDRRGDLWVTDFGMADVQGEAGLTVTGDLPGTLRYMSAEQALGRRALIDRRTDVYALGATLYELATLRPAVGGAERHEIFRRIVEEEPTPIRRLNPAIPADLATVITKAISKEPSARYDTAWDLADDLGRFLEGRPIAARPAGSIERGWRWCRRKPVHAALVASLLMSVVIAFAGLAWNWREAVREKDLMSASKETAQAAEKEARHEAATATAINRFLTDTLLGQATAAEGEAADGDRPTLRDGLDRASASVARTFEGRPEAEMAVRRIIGSGYHDLAEYGKAEANYQAALDLLARHPGQPAADRIEATLELCHMWKHLGRNDEAEGRLVATIAESTRLLGPVHRLTIDAATSLGDLYKKLGRFEEAETLYRRVVADSRANRGLKHRSTIQAMNNLGAILQKMDRFDEAVPLFRECLALNREILGPRHASTITGLYNLSFVLKEMGRLDEAEGLLREYVQVCREATGHEDRRSLEAASRLASLLSARGKLDEAEALLAPTLKAQRNLLGPTHPDAVASERLAAAIRKAKGPRPQPANSAIR